MAHEIHAWTPQCPAVQLPARALVPGLIVLNESTYRWQPVYSASTDSVNRTVLVYAGVEPVRDRARGIHGNTEVIVHAPDVTGLPLVEDNPDLTFVDYMLSKMQPTTIGLAPNERASVAAWLAATDPVVALPGSRAVSPGWNVQAATSQYAEASSMDLVVRYAARRRQVEVFRQVAVIARQMPYQWAV